MVEIKGYDNYEGDKLTSTSPIKSFATNKIIFEDGSELSFKEILSAPEKYGICEINKINIINNLVDAIKNIDIKVEHK